MRDETRLLDERDEIVAPQIVSQAARAGASASVGMLRPGTARAEITWLRCPRSFTSESYSLGRTYNESTAQPNTAAKTKSARPLRRPSEWTANVAYSRSLR